MVRRGMARHGKAGKAGRDGARHGMARSGEAGLSGLGWASRGLEWRGVFWQGKATMNLLNREGYTEFNIRPDWYKGRAPGLSALVRLHNEEVWCQLALESIVDWCDEIVITLNCCTDRTPEIVERFRAAHVGKVRVYDYPHRIWQMGPRHSECPPDSVYASAYFYNYTQSKSTRSHVVKLDGDLIVFDWLGTEIRRLMA